ncbi:MAG: 2-oxo acid dehydrogenase subunit E2 [Holosporaceae bacterium]|jgi:2-oxoglutarate dehydrogenase E2 component (dihydrolipoamide succinyltransferase)|nr:2-oxo acid dehydrogenase subunit E2 [Holosporaceae bacterium]
MRIDIIVPTFDDTSEEVTLSSWYKKVGDKISKNEIIADAETSSVACGITSSYECILAKILVQEGGMISQGAKIAVIETDLNAFDVIQSEEKQEEIKKESEELLSTVSAQIEQEEEKLGNVERTTTQAQNNDNGYCLSVPLEEEKQVEEAKEVVAEMSEYTEEKCKTILKNAENQAKEEAQKLKIAILEEAQKVAKLQAEEQKSKILKEYEEKATKEATEMHQKIIQGSLQEAEDTKTKLIEEAKEKALQEAEKIKEKILEKARKEAEFEANALLFEKISKANDEAKQKAETISKEIIEEAIAESKREAKEIKKDIIHSSRKYAAKEAENMVKNLIKEAKNESYLQAKELVSSSQELALKETESLKRDILKNAEEEIRSTSNSLLRDVISEITKEINKNIEEIKKESDRLIKDEVKTLSKNIKKEEAVIQAENSKIIADYELLREEQDLSMKIKEEKLSQIEKENEIVKQLLSPGNKDVPTEVYADNWNKPKFFDSPGDYNEPIDMLQKRISEKMKDSYDASVISTVSNEVDMSAVLSLEKAFGKAFSKKHNTRLGFTPFFISASIAALKQYRIFNAHIRNDEIIYKNNFDISIITCGNDGIAAPVIRNADVLTIAEIEKAMILLSRRAIEGTLSIEEVSGGTFTVINAGIYGSLIGTDLLTPPQVATLSVHKMHNRPIATDNGMEIKPMLYISLSYDHRISDTRKASEFISNIKSYVENPGWQVLGLC